MRHSQEFYINGVWTTPLGNKTLSVINPATEKPVATLALGTAEDVQSAVAAAKKAFNSWSSSTRAERLVVLQKILDIYQRRSEDMAQAISLEMGSPIERARDSQTWAGQAHIAEMIEALKRFVFEEKRDHCLITREAVGVCALITPWNWPMNQVTCKVAPALAAGCTMVLKPSEVAPLSSIIFAEIVEEAGLPPGVFNMVHGTGPDVGEALSRHPDVDMVSLTGSTRAGAAVAHAAADSIKRVHQELGGKSPNIILDDADLTEAVRSGVSNCFSNSGQSCDAPTRMLVPRNRMNEALEIARARAEELKVGNPEDSSTDLGPVVSDLQYDRIQALIERGIAEGATLVTGGLGRPEGLSVGYYVKPTIFGNVTADMTVFKEEIFGPVLSIIAYDDEEHAIALAHDTVYGLAAYIQSGDLERARKIARRLRAGNVNINGSAWTVKVPFGGFGQSGNGRECSDFGLHDFTEVKAVIGWDTV
ncbi:aldehyde dehydrogenase [Neokomagataea thailandica NBRC 106555]|uniref:Aldehyde dehydrogenase family protein n=2 Tax=Neokomagataea TaxID=1223423 RepID=A0A4Y6V9C9_9PROT|nr:MULTISPECIES: aldehyde dehydrogenase family protein [Neokomagataea]QDH25518.1 aldehyde dehydrogenase family protein [Neokomagataea tanensis]GBR55043.1 aldehyde dehydrogenase [Neokomagataea thailandica NBRC 106555]